MATGEGMIPAIRSITEGPPLPSREPSLSSRTSAVISTHCGFGSQNKLFCKQSINNFSNIKNLPNKIIIVITNKRHTSLYKQSYINNQETPPYNTSRTTSRRTLKTNFQDQTYIMSMTTP